jgi:hypothetical protein
MGSETPKTLQRRRRAQRGRLRREVGGRHCRRRRGVDRDGELDVAAELLGKGLGDQGAQPGLQLFLDEFVRGGDEGGVLHQPEGAGLLQPGPLVRLDLKVAKTVQGPCPDVCKV